MRAALPSLFLPALILFLAGCRATAPLAPVDVSRPGWTARQGQAVWTTEGSELAGELILATRRDGGFALQFIKTPLPLVSAQSDGDRWTIRFPAENRVLSGKGNPSRRLLWLHLPSALAGKPLPRGLRYHKSPDGGWELRNERAGERISGFLSP